MCGITGFLDLRPANRVNRETMLRAMTNSLRHRGPDDSGAWIDAEAGIALGHRRLAIIDLSPAGHQPMVSADGRFVITYNGEIYNYPEIVEDLLHAGVALRGRSDTEALLESCARWGVAHTLARCEGMFAFALWDRRERDLVLARDRLGIKPLYWGRPGEFFLFGSELKALCHHPGWRPEIDRDALAAFLRLGYVPAPYSIYRGVNKLEPGTFLTLRSGGEPRVEWYWDIRNVAAQAQRRILEGSEIELLNALEGTLRRAVRNEMVSDVPLGVFLSGGIDSSLVAALMQAESAQPVKSFTIGFAQAQLDEAPHAKRVAHHLGTDHTELYVEEGAVRAIIPDLPVWYDEPFADDSQIPTHLVSRLARQHVTVALSGDGGDELFAGYRKYQRVARIARTLKALPSPLRQSIGALLCGLQGRPLDRLLSFAPIGVRPPASKIHKIGNMLRDSNPMAIHRSVISLWADPDAVVIAGREPHGLLWGDAAQHDIPDTVECMQFVDTLTYLPDDILAKVDRASMAVSLETRVPLLNHRVVEFAWSLPPGMRLRRNTSKWAIRQILYRHVPPDLIDRPKQGFGVPLGQWLRGPLRDWADDLLAETGLRRGGWLRSEPIQARWSEHRRGEHDWSASLWCVLMFQSWLGENGAAASAVAAGG